MKQVHYLISDAAKLIEVESHVLRYWEEELGIPIKRNDLGHRYYTQDDVDRFREIKKLKEQGLQLKAIRMILKNGKLERLQIDSGADNKENRIKQDEQGCGEKTGNEETHMIEIIGKRELTEEETDSKEEKGIRLQILLQHMISEAVKENNRELSEDIKECILKEMDYQFRQQEEKSEEWETQRRQREDEHYQKIDEMIRNYSKKGKRKESSKTISFGTRKKPSIV